MEADRPAAVIAALLRDGEPVTFRARGSSMWPALRDGALVEVTPCAAAELRVGEVAAYERDGRVVVHRVTRAGDAAVRFAGDALEQPDGDIPAASVLGRATVLEQRRLRPRLPTARHLRLLWRYARRRLRRGMRW